MTTSDHGPAFGLEVPYGFSLHMIESLKLVDFKGHRDTTVPLGRFTALVGPNGSGKSSVLEALWLQSRLIREKRQAVLSGDWEENDLRRRGSAGTIVFASTGSTKGQKWSLTLKIRADSDSFAWKWGNKSLPEQPWGAGPRGNFSSAIGTARLYQLDGTKIASAAYSDEPNPEVERDGTNTAVSLAALKLGFDEAFEQVERKMRRLIPNVERIRIRQAQVQRRKNHQVDVVLGSQVYFDFKGAPDVPAHAASEGTLVTLALLTILHSPRRPNMILLDDFDRSLHPQAQMEFVRVVKQLLEEEEDVQVVVTTHSPYILDEFAPSDVHVFALDDEQTVVVKSLAEHPEAEKMKGVLTSGQIWSLAPEHEWVTRQP